MLARIRQVTSGEPSQTPPNIIAFWIDADVADHVIEGLTESMKAVAQQSAIKQGMTLKEMVYLDNLMGIWVGMQENIGL